ncbi:hypothetical protein [Cryobacterium luteum]|uniref:Uncharacterized protein n=1 Tax=Cryobacterium luteum TaxID=1424661 RepID=A0A1H8LGH3_9MICO|nr:hypothetical protein [Cryobacterium luteum]TFB91331.1 hypothetical protein E3O10_06620 [Cryobacterium luteum]SEO03848.1 hypothetical protein SAMN05216281_1279 [Cryobacterium luteum]
MSTFGLEFAIAIPTDVTELEEKVDDIYLSLSKNFAIVSIDAAVNERNGSPSLLLGVSVPEGMEAQSLVIGVCSDAINKALSESGLQSPADETVWRPSARIREFA